ncbi:MAG: polysaccharide deacetylase family protein [Candidatus Pacearchaeota archaeon]
MKKKRVIIYNSIFSTLIFILFFSVSAESLCQYASSASATSQNNLGSLASYSTGEPNAQYVGQCTQWSGYGYSWSPSNWNVRANLTLSYAIPVNVTNITIFGDYDICWDKMWLKNSPTGETIRIFSGFENSCIATKNINQSFIADTIILQTCGWSWSSTDAVRLCGNILNSTLPPINNTNITINNIEICQWKGCKKGAVSISVDDYFTSCISELDSHGYKGTYFLSNTNTYSNNLWNQFNNAFNNGHELAPHTQSHWCVGIPQNQWIQDIENNIIDITSRTNAKREDLISFAYPCGYNTENMQNIIRNNWNFISARGYYFNELEDATPSNYFNMKSFNSHDYPGGIWEPPSYYYIVDRAEAEGKWANLVYHNECSDDGVINYLPIKNVWVDTIGNVVKYTYLRDNSTIYNFQNSTNEIKFNIDVDNRYDQIYYNQNLTLMVKIPVQTISNVKSNNLTIDFSYQTINNSRYVVFDTPFPINDEIIISY